LSPEETTEPLFRFRTWNETASLKANAAGRVMSTSTAPKTLFLLFMIVVLGTQSSMPIPRECQRCRGESHQGDGQNGQECEEGALDEQLGNDPHEQAVEREHEDVPADGADDERTAAEQAAV